VALLGGSCLAPAPMACSDPISYVLFGPLEQADAGSREPGAWADEMMLIYDGDGYRIYATEPSRR
jgi:hypothetical protein